MLATGGLNAERSAMRNDRVSRTAILALRKAALILSQQLSQDVADSPRLVALRPLWLVQVILPVIVHAAFLPMSSL